MKKLLALGVSVMLIGGGMLTQAVASEFVINTENSIFFNNFENVYDSNGDLLSQDQVVAQGGLQEGDHLFGIFNVQNIDSFGSSHFVQDNSPVDQISGIFAQRVIRVENSVGNPDPFDNTQTVPHVTLGTPTLTSYGGIDVSGLLDVASNEMFAFWRDQGNSAFTAGGAGGGSLQTDVDNATDGMKWLSIGYNAGADGDFATSDDSGYAYSHVDSTATLQNLAGEAFAALDVILNNTGVLFAKDLNDPNESEIGGPGGLIDNLLNQIYLTSEFEGNPVFLAGNSLWQFASNDPAVMHPVPEPSTLLLIGGSLIGLAAFRKKIRK